VRGLGEIGAGFGFLNPVPGFAIIQLRHGLAGFNTRTFFDQHGRDARAYRRADLGPMHWLHIAGGINRLHCGARGRSRDSDGRRQAAPNPGACQAEQNQYKRDDDPSTHYVSLA